MSKIVAQGGTVTLDVVYKDGLGALRDPVDPLLEILDPLGDTFVDGLVPVHDDTGEYHYDWDVDSGAALGDWIGRFTGTIDGLDVQGDDEFTVVLPGSAYPASGDLITLEEFKIAMGEALGDTEDDAKYEAAIAEASNAIRNYTGRSLGLANEREERIYEYDGSGWLDIDDTAHIYSVEMTPGGVGAVTRTLDASEWRGEAFMAPIMSWLVLPMQQFAISPAMGFTRNEDILAAEGRLLGGGMTVTVDADWGWPDVPPAVKRAAVWTAASFVDDPKPYVRESIDTYSRALGPAPNAAVPDRALELLTPYVRVNV